MKKNTPLIKSTFSNKHKEISKDTKSTSDHFDVCMKTNSIIERNRQERINSFK